MADATIWRAPPQPGVKLTEPDMVLGMALAAQGKYAEAAPVFDFDQLRPRGAPVDLLHQDQGESGHRRRQVMA